MTMIAYATFDHHDAALVQAVSAKVMHMPNAFDPQAIANTLWALALLDDLSPPVWNCLLVSFVQAERFNSKTIVICIDVGPGHWYMPVLQGELSVQRVLSSRNASILSCLQNTRLTKFHHYCELAAQILVSHKPG